jgi:hypothetical protein
MPYNRTLAEDVERAKAILEKGRPAHEEVAYLPTEALRAAALSGGTIYGGDVYVAYKLLQSFVEVLDAVGPKVAELALRHQRMAAADDAPPPSITCPRCQRTSYNRHDIEQRYCGGCHAFHADMPGARDAS